MAPLLVLEIDSARTAHICPLREPYLDTYFNPKRVRQQIASLFVSVVPNFFMALIEPLHFNSLSGLYPPELGINAIVSQQLFMFTLFDNPALLHYIDTVSMADGG